MGALLLGLVSSVLHAQSTPQSIQGLVQDSSGAVIVGAKVTILNVATGVSRQAETNETGNYSFPLVPVGNYNVRAELEGFRSETVTNLRVETGAQVRQDFRMVVGSVTETVEVAANAVTLQTENATVGAVIENRRIVELPLNGRNVQNLAVLVPGVQYGLRTGLGDGSAGFPIPGQGFSVSANGQREIHQVVSLDGVDAKDPRIHITNFVPSIEAIEEFKIETNSYSAEVGFGGGARVNITMKSGTNNLHGTFFNFLRNDAFDSEHYFLNFERPADAERLKKNTLRQNQFGFVISGPVLIPKVYNGKNKTFWAFNYEARRTREGVVSTEWWPNEAFRRGDFSSVQFGAFDINQRFRNPILIYDPFTGDPFPNNIIPASRLHPGAQNILNLYVPQPTFIQDDPLDFTARQAVRQPVNVNTYFSRVDHYFSDKDRVFARLAWDRSSRENNHINPNLGVSVTSKVTNLATQWIHTFSPNMINEVRVGFNKADDITQNPRMFDESFDMDALGVGEFRIRGDGNRRLSLREQGIPQMNGIGFTMLERTAGNGFDNMNSIQAGNHISLISGRHNFKFGGEVYLINMERGAANLAEGALDFSGLQTGHGFASFLMGLPNQTRTPEGLPLTYPMSNRVGLYVHDDWKVTPKLTVNIGMRFDYVGVPRDREGLWRTLSFPGDRLDVDGGQGYTKPDGTVIPIISPPQVGSDGAVKLFNQDVRFFMPRLGIAYRPAQKWVLRMGGGWYDNINHLNTFTIFNLMPPKAGNEIYNTQTVPARSIPVAGLNGRTFNIQTRRFTPTSNILTMDDPFLARTGGARTIRPVNVIGSPTDYNDGSVWKWSFDIQRELPWQSSLTVGYAGSKGYHVGNSVSNFNNPRFTSVAFNENNRPFTEFYDPALPELGVQRLGNIRYIDSYGESFYHGLQARFDKRTSSGLTVGVAYTYSKSHGDGENGGQEGAGFQNPLDRYGSRGLYRFDQTHRAVTHFVWNLPGGNLPGALKHVIGNWQANGIFTIASGFPFSVNQGTGDVGLPTGPVRPDAVAGWEIDSPSRSQWYNPQAFQRVTCQIAGRPELCRLGNAGYNIVRGPGQSQTDFSMYKNIPISEGTSVQFRWEAYNIFNTPWFGQPGGISFSTANQIVPDGPRDGEIRSLRVPMRRMQFGLKLFF
ncbi:MAG: carboxypeptidase-like regulatory domain-containing protein [Bryobacteraceae bacterium]